MPMQREPTAKERRKFAELRQKAKERRQRNGSTTMWTLQKLENIQYVIDKDNFLRYSLPLVANKVSCGNKFRMAYYRVTRGWLDRMEWKTIAACADAMRIPAELLVDEEYYYSRCGLAGYRVVFEAHRKGVSLADLTYCQGQSDHPKYQFSWYALWYMFLKGSLNLQKYLNLQHLTTIIHLCNERLGLPLGALVGRMLHHDSGSSGVLGELADVLTALDERDCALVAGVAKAIHNSKAGGIPLEGQVKRLLEWYNDGSSSQDAG